VSQVPSFTTWKRPIPGIVLVLVLAYVAVLFDAPVPLRVVAGTLLALLLPGLGLVAALLPRRLETLDLLVFVPGLSIVSDIAAGLLLQAAGIKLSTTAFATALAAITLLSLAWAATHGWFKLPVPPRPRLGFAGLVSVAVSVGVAAIVHGVDGQPTASTAFTQLWALRGSASAVHVGFRSHERATTEFRMAIRVGGRQRLTRRVTLAPGAQWHTVIEADRRRPVDVTLAKVARAGTYRRVRLRAATALG
jgi:uncharacterized membrane protein